MRPATWWVRGSRRGATVGSRGADSITVGTCVIGLAGGRVEQSGWVLLPLCPALDVAVAEFGSRLSNVSDADWGSPTPCTDWDVRYLVAHVVGGNRFAALVLDGMSSDGALERIMSEPQLGTSPMRDFEQAGRLVAEAALGPHRSPVRMTQRAENLDLLSAPRRRPRVAPVVARQPSLFTGRRLPSRSFRRTRARGLDPRPSPRRHRPESRLRSGCA